MITRGIAGFFAVFSIISLLLRLASHQFDANLWWLDLRPLSAWIASIAVACCAGALLIHASGLRLGRRLRCITGAIVAGAAFIALLNALNFLLLLERHRLTTRLPIPFSLIVSAMLGTITYRMLAATHNASATIRRSHWLAAFLACAVLFPLAQILFFGHTDYRRRADAIVVFGARAYANGKPSPILADRVRTGCELYHEGYAPTLIFSGGPGDGGVDEPHAMQTLAESLGVPASAIILDSHGLNTDATVHNTRAILPTERTPRLLAVSHGYHLPRIKMAYQRAGMEVYTVPATEHARLPSRTFALLRESAALWVYYVNPRLIH